MAEKTNELINILSREIDIFSRRKEEKRNTREEGVAHAHNTTIGHICLFQSVPRNFPIYTIKFYIKLPNWRCGQLGLFLRENGRI